MDECHDPYTENGKRYWIISKTQKILGLTATPTPEAYAFFNNNIIEQYTYDDSVVDSINVPARVYGIITMSPLAMIDKKV